jgi:mono/diheme cytochrome c family protein
VHTSVAGSVDAGFKPVGSKPGAGRAAIKNDKLAIDIRSQGDYASATVLNAVRVDARRLVSQLEEAMTTSNARAGSAQDKLLKAAYNSIINGASYDELHNAVRRHRRSCGVTTILRSLLLLAGVLLVLPLHAAQLTVELANGPRTWDTAQLLQHPGARDIDIPNDVSYKRVMHYRAVPMAALLEGVASDAHLQAIATDGFAAEMPAGPLLQKSGSVAWLAVEDPAHPWPGLGTDKPGAGPFYLVWTDPAASKISPEQWPYAVGKIRLLASVAERFPALLPDPKLAADDPVNKGFALFQKNCLACHRLNGAGDAQLGPDLNIPHNPTEYFAADYLKLYIRNPQNLRQWSQAKMPAITQEVLSDEELNQVVGYLKHMAGRKVAQ